MAFDPPSIKLDKNLMICYGQIKTIDAGKGFKSYLWNTGGVGETIFTTTMGKYWVTVKDANNCSASDTTNIKISEKLPADFLPVDTSKCYGAILSLTAQHIYINFLWNTGSTNSSIDVKNAGTYWLQVTDANGCIGKDSIKIVDLDCSENVYAPSGFTPNGDGLNDFFRPKITGAVAQYEFIIVWGKRYLKVKIKQ